MAELSRRDEKLKYSIARRIKQLREETKLTQSQFAKENLIDRQTLNRWENGRGVTIYTIAKFCEILNVTLVEFFDDNIFIGDK